MFACWWNLSLEQGAVNVALSVIHVSVSVANNFIHRQTADDYGYHTLVNWLGSSTVCYRRSSRGPLCRLWSSGTNMFCPITPSFLQFLMGSFWPGHRCWQLSTRLGVHTWSGNSNVMPVDFWKSLLPPCCRLWLPAQRLDRVWAVSVQRSSAAVTIMRHFSCWVFCSMVLERGWVKGSEIEACRSEYQSFVQEQRQLERSSTRSRPDVGDVLSFCCSQAGFRARQHLFKVCIVTNVVKFHDRYLESNDFAFSGFPVYSSHCARTTDLWWVVHHQFGSGDDLWGRGAKCDPLRRGLWEESAFHAAELLFRLRGCDVDWICSYLWQDHKQRCLRAMEPRGDYVSFSGGSWRLWVCEWGSWSAEDVEGLTRAVVCGGWNQAVIRGFDIAIRCEDLECCGRGTGGVCSRESSFS